MLVYLSIYSMGALFSSVLLAADGQVCWRWARESSAGAFAWNARSLCAPHVGPKHASLTHHNSTTLQELALIHTDTLTVAYLRNYFAMNLSCLFFVRSNSVVSKVYKGLLYCY